MTTTIIIVLCVLVLAAYLFDLTSAKTKIPSVILLLLTGWLIRQFIILFSLTVPDLSPALPILGTVGLILIVLEGSLELELDKTKAPLIIKSFVTALVPMLILAFGLAFVFWVAGSSNYRLNLINAIPLCVISSAIAIPSVQNCSKHRKEFVVYESSFSDILGVMFFNFIIENHFYGIQAFGDFSVQLLVISVFSFVATMGLVLLLRKIDSHVKFVPMIFVIILIYEISKVYHLPGLIFILMFGLFLGNVDEMRKIRQIKKWIPENLDADVHRFRNIISEGCFLIRTLFFLLFGYLIDTSELLNSDTLIWAVGITVAIYGLRAIQLKFSRLSFFPLLFIAPRGLITILLFVSIGSSDLISFANRSLIIQVIVLTSLVMMMGFILNPLLKNKKAAKEKMLIDAEKF